MSDRDPMTNTNRSPAGAGPARILDFVERGFVIGLYGWLVVRLMTSYVHTGNVANLILLASEGLVVVFILIRRPASQLSFKPADWLLAMSATVVPLLVQPGERPAFLNPNVAVLLMLVGLIFQVSAKVALGRSFGCVPAHRGLILGGPYRFVRHPIYTGYLLSHVAFLLMNPTLWNAAIYGLAYVLQVTRLLAEERLLEGDPRYRHYMSAVRYRLLPGLF